MDARFVKVDVCLKGIINMWALAIYGLKKDDVNV
jgi:hypothetical protein